MNSYILYRGENLNSATIVAENIKNKDELFKVIEKNTSDIKVYYYRFWADDNNYLHIDYGSHSDFFIIDAKVLEESPSDEYEEGQIVELDNGQLMFYWRNTLDDETRSRIIAK